MTINQPCVSPGTGTLSPDLRVFYQYGMVLGLDDFLQEQTHNLALDYHHERALHGYGTVYGLHVTTSTPSGAPDDVEVNVGPGMAIDQWGREITIETAQCARLGAWLAAQEEASAGTVEANLGISGELVVYVVAAYAECPDDLVPLPGQPCSTSTQVQVPSRLRDAWDIELRWSPPAMPAWDVIRELAELLNSVEIVSGLDPSHSSEATLVAAVLALATPATPSGSPPLTPPAYQLPAATADAAFDRILTAWVTEVRPQIAPDLTAPDPAWDPAVLLSTVTFTPELPFSTSDPEILSYGDPDDTGRPYLLSTELIQELRLGGGAATAAPPAPVHEAVTLASTDDSTAFALTAWFHLSDPVALPATIGVVDESGQAWTFTTSSDQAFTSEWTLSPPTGFAVDDGDQLAATFPGTGVLVGNSATTLAAVAVGQGLLDVTGTGDLTAYVTARKLGSGPASVPFVTITYVPAIAGSVQADVPSLELWFHLQPAGTKETVTMVKPEVEVIDDMTGNVIFPPSGQAPVPTATAHQNVWTIGSAEFLKLPYLRVLVSTKGTAVKPPSGSEVSLAEWIQTSGLRYVGWESAGETVVSFLRVPSNTVTDK